MRYANRFLCVIRRAAVLLLILTIGGARHTAGQTTKGARSKEQSSFSLEQPLKEPVQVRNGALQILKKDFSVTASGCDDDQVSAAWFEASELHLEGPLEVQLLVTRLDPESQRGINRYRNARVGAVAGGHPVFVIYRFDDQR